MGKKILLIGGTYFVGRVFAILAYRQGYELTFINRGKYSMKELGNRIQEYVCDRHDKEQLNHLKLEKRYDALVDFCAYNPGDISLLFEYLPCEISHYIYLSTADVYLRSKEVKNEKSPMQCQKPDDEVGLYTYHKMLLEDELRLLCGKYDCNYTILRPAFIFGPYNYAPRESWFIKDIIQKNMVNYPVDSTGCFQMVYVKDVGEAIIRCIQSEKSKNKSYNLSAPEVLNYRRFLDVLKEVSGIDFHENHITVSEALLAGLPFPFPLTDEENELFDGSKIVDELGINYTDLNTAMKATFHAFKQVYEK